MSGLIIRKATPHTYTVISSVPRSVPTNLNLYGVHVHLDKTVCHDVRGVGDVLYQVECPNFRVTWGSLMYM